MIKFSILSPHRSFIGFEIRKGLEPMGIDNKLYLQKNIVIGMGFMFGYIDLTFNTGKPISIEESLSEFEPLQDNGDL